MRKRRHFRLAPYAIAPSVAEARSCEAMGSMGKEALLSPSMDLKLVGRYLEYTIS
jgi:hypothetical protein